MASCTTSSPSFPMSHLSTINVSNFISSKIRGDKISNNYTPWKKQMLCLISSQDLVGFINGEIQPHKAEDYAIWRTDSLVMGWILGALNDAVLETVANLTTARDVWLELEKIFGDPAGQSQTQMRQAAGNEWHDYLPLYRATVTGDWTRAVGILNQDSNAIKASLNSGLQTTLHIAIGRRKAIDFVQELVNYMPRHLLGQADKFGNTALHVAAQAGNTEGARILVSRRLELLHQTNNAGEFPVHVAAISGCVDTLRYLISETRDDDVLPSPYHGETGAKLLCNVIDSKAFDIALHLADDHPELSRMKLEDGSSALKSIALNETAAEKEKELDLRNRLLKYRSVSHWREIDKQATKLVKRLCKNMESLDYCQASAIYEDAILAAARLGNRKMIEEIIATFPAAIYARDIYNKQSIFHVAAENRHEEVFNLIYHDGNLKNQISNMRDSSGNTFLHSAARLAAPQKLSLVIGAALQMRSEILWFKKIQTFLQPNLREAANNAGKTPWMVFTEEHASLKAEGEKWVKDTGNACMIVAALVATVSFAAAITVPGGNDSSTGHPLLSNKSYSKQFTLYNNFSFGSSVTSLLLFMSSTTLRYTYQDFQFHLPTRLRWNFYMLYVSVIFMLKSFDSAVNLLSGQNYSAVLTSRLCIILPTLTFMYLQISLLWTISFKSRHSKIV